MNSGLDSYPQGFGVTGILGTQDTPNTARREMDNLEEEILQEFLEESNKDNLGDETEYN